MPKYYVSVLKSDSTCVGHSFNSKMYIENLEEEIRIHNEEWPKKDNKIIESEKYKWDDKDKKIKIKE